MKPAKRIAYCAMLTALAMVFSYIEMLIPFSFGIPGIKLGLANIVVLTGLYFFPAHWIFLVMASRVTLMSFLFGNMSMLIYSFAGGTASFFIMLIMKKIKGFSITGISIAGGVSHNIAQLIVAAIAVQNIKTVYYFPILIISGAVTGGLIGMTAHRVENAINRQ